MTASILLFDTRILGDTKTKPSTYSLSEKPQRRRLCCSVCRSPVTGYEQATEIEHKHIHVKRNPTGQQFRFGCYYNAEGCGNLGDFFSKYSWFVGYNWCITLCVSCNIQLGWCFSGEQVFYALILEQLVDCNIG